MFGAVALVLGRQEYQSRERSIERRIGSNWKLLYCGEEMRRDSLPARYFARVEMIRKFQDSAFLLYLRVGLFIELRPMYLITQGIERIVANLEAQFIIQKTKRFDLGILYTGKHPLISPVRCAVI